jgi:pimeloyl-ACP methyl ester carboxylesterase
MAPEELTLETAYLRLAAQRWHVGAPLKVLALHGWLDNAASFATLAPRLTGCDLVALEGWARFAILGHSLGAGIGCFVAAIAPGAVTGLALVEGLGPLSGSPDDDPDRLAEATQQMAAHALREPRVYPDVETAVTARVRAGGVGKTGARLLVERALQPTGGGFAWRSEAQVLAFLARIRCPAQLLTGADAELAARPEFAARCRAVRGLDHRVLPGGHHLHLDDPGQVVGPLTSFLEGLADPDA